MQNNYKIKRSHICPGCRHLLKIDECNAQFKENQTQRRSFFWCYNCKVYWIFANDPKLEEEWDKSILQSLKCEIKKKKL